jgi:hypothetical protein
VDDEPRASDSTTEMTALITRSVTYETRHLIFCQSGLAGEGAPIDDEIIWNESRACRQSAEYYLAEYLNFVEAVYNMPKNEQPAAAQGKLSLLTLTAWSTMLGVELISIRDF